MTMISSAASQPASRMQASSRIAGQIPSAGLGRLLGGLAQGLVTYWARREAIKVLSEMDDRALRDIGIVRSQIEEAVHGVVDPTFGYIR
jgi:uncharacterized protein YjiS (DUF1127 family)